MPITKSPKRTDFSIVISLSYNSLYIVNFSISWLGIQCLIQSLSYFGIFHAYLGYPFVFCIDISVLLYDIVLELLNILSIV